MWMIVADQVGIKDIKLKGKHNLLNLLAAATCADIYGVKIEDIKNVFKTFKGIPHRIEYVTTLMGVDYINDSKATNINSVIVAIKTYNKPTILLLGGVNKGVDFGLLVPHIKNSNIKLYFNSRVLSRYNWASSCNINFTIFYIIYWD